MTGERATKPCAECGQELTRLVSQARGKNWYCGPVCQAAHSPHRITLSGEPNPLRGQRDTRPCAFCSKPVTRYLSQRRVDQVWTCSRTCAATLRGRALVAAGTWNQPRKPRTGDTIPCEVCGKPFYRQPAYIKQGRRFCSRQCNNVWQTKTPVVKACAHCGKEMRLQPSKGQLQHCSRACQFAAKTLRPTGRTHNGRPVIQNFHGYLTVYEPTHPKANKWNGRVLEHRLVMETVLGRYLLTDEHVDHINQDKTDNRPENLQILSPTAHQRKTIDDKERAIRKLRDQVAAFREKYGPLESD